MVPIPPATLGTCSILTHKVARDIFRYGKRIPIWKTEFIVAAIRGGRSGRNIDLFYREKVAP
jgi:hypothetical protein